MVPFLTGHMWLIRVGPHRAPDTLKMTTAPQELFYVIFVLFREKSGAKRELRGEVKIQTRSHLLEWPRGAKQ